MKIFLSLLMVSGVAIADDAAILRCRTIADVNARLACYDALTVAPANTASSGVGSKATNQAGTSAQPSSPPPATPTAQFGLEEKLANKAELDAIESSIPGSFEGWNARSIIKLANGQAWQISDDSSRAHYIDNPKGADSPRRARIVLS